MFILSRVRVVPTLVAIICDMLNLVVHYVMIHIMVLIWKLPNISTDFICMQFYHARFTVSNEIFVKDQVLGIDRKVGNS
jgi:hypothetical protein